MACAIVQEYGISVADMAPDFSMSLGGKRRKVDIAIFSHGAPHTLENLARGVIVKPEPVKKGAGILRTHEQTDKDLEDLLTATPKARYGLWTNGLELFFVERHATKFEDTFSPIGEWPMGDESLGTRNFASVQRLRRADADML